jgi:hypothetical protein
MLPGKHPNIEAAERMEVFRYDRLFAQRGSDRSRPVPMRRPIRTEEARCRHATVRPIGPAERTSYDRLAWQSARRPFPRESTRLKHKHGLRNKPDSLTHSRQHRGFRLSFACALQSRRLQFFQPLPSRPPQRVRNRPCNRSRHAPQHEQKHKGGQHRKIR